MTTLTYTLYCTCSVHVQYNELIYMIIDGKETLHNVIIMETHFNLVACTMFIQTNKAM